mgnify:CR=1 FL=1
MGVFVCYNDEMSLNPELSDLINSSAEVIQFAKDGKYEEAWIISLKDDLPSNDEINEYVSADDYGKLNYQGLAFIYNFDGSKSGPYHILKTPCCYRQGDEWVVDIDLVNKNMRKMIEL